jgi:uncharacterized protein (TIGR03382 family)
MTLRLRAFLFVTAMVAGGLITTSAQAETLVDFTPAGDELCCDDPDYGVKGYRFTAARTFTGYEAQWLVEVPAGTSAEARIWDTNGNLLQEGSTAIGDGTEQWISSAFEFTFEAGQTYEVVFFLEAPDDAQFRRITGAPFIYEVLPYLVDVQSRSRYGHEDGPTTTYNTWPPYMRLSLDAPDADGDGVSDDSDMCPAEPAEPPDADGDGCTDPPDADPSTSTSDGTGTSDGADTGDAEATGDSTQDSGLGTGTRSDDADTGETHPTSPVTDASAPSSGSNGCQCTAGHGGPAGPTLLVLVASGLLRRRRGHPGK